MGETRKIKVNRSVTKNKLLDYGFRYKENGDLENTIISACNFMAKTISETAPVFDVDNFLNSAKDKIVFQLINTEQNKSFLEKVPHREFQDLSIIYRWVVSYIQSCYKRRKREYS